MSKHRVPREAMVSPSLEILKEDTALVAQLEQGPAGAGPGRLKARPPHAHLNHIMVQRTPACLRAQLPKVATGKVVPLQHNYHTQGFNAKPPQPSTTTWEG